MPQKFPSTFNSCAFAWRLNWKNIVDSPPTFVRKTMVLTCLRKFRVLFVDPRWIPLRKCHRRHGKVVDASKPCRVGLGRLFCCPAPIHSATTRSRCTGGARSTPSPWTRASLSETKQNLCYHSNLSKSNVNLVCGVCIVAMLCSVVFSLVTAKLSQPSNGCIWCSPALTVVEIFLCCSHDEYQWLWVIYL